MFLGDGFIFLWGCLWPDQDDPRPYFAHTCFRYCRYCWVNLRWFWLGINWVRVWFNFNLFKKPQSRVRNYNSIFRTYCTSHKFTKRFALRDFLVYFFYMGWECPVVLHFGNCAVLLSVRYYAIFCSMLSISFTVEWWWLLWIWHFNNNELLSWLGSLTAAQKWLPDIGRPHILYRDNSCYFSRFTVHRTVCSKITWC